MQNAGVELEIGMALRVENSSVRVFDSRDRVQMSDHQLVQINFLQILPTTNTSWLSGSIEFSEIRYRFYSQTKQNHLLIGRNERREHF